jgi:hypothetical protein
MNEKTKTLTDNDVIANLELIRLDSLRLNEDDRPSFIHRERSKLFVNAGYDKGDCFELPLSVGLHIF